MKKEKTIYVTTVEIIIAIINTNAVQRLNKYNQQINTFNRRAETIMSQTY